MSKNSISGKPGLLAYFDEFPVGEAVKGGSAALLAAAAAVAAGRVQQLPQGRLLHRLQLLILIFINPAGSKNEIPECVWHGPNIYKDTNP